MIYNILYTLYIAKNTCLKTLEKSLNYRMDDSGYI